MNGISSPTPLPLTSKVSSGPVVANERPSLYRSIQRSQLIAPPTWTYCRLPPGIRLIPRQFVNASVPAPAAIRNPQLSSVYQSWYAASAYGRTSIVSRAPSAAVTTLSFAPRFVSKTSRVAPLMGCMYVTSPPCSRASIAAIVFSGKSYGESLPMTLVYKGGTSFLMLRKPM